MSNMKQIIKNFNKASIAVVGDICLDMYYFLTDEKSEISVETGLRTHSVSGFKHEAGGAGNVAINLKTLGASQVDIYGVIGNDPFADILLKKLKEAEVSCSHVKTQNKNWHSHVYHKCYKNGHEEPRLDIGNFNKVNPEIIQSILKDLEANIQNYQAIIINEQILNGYHNPLFQEGLSRLIEKYRESCLWICDSRHLNHIYNHSIRKLNIHEARSFFTRIKGTETDIPENGELAQWLSLYWSKPVVITLGEEGAIAIDKEGKLQKTPGINLIAEKDTVGAGDAFLAAMTLALASGNSLRDALYIGNCTASVSVTKLYETGHPRIDEVESMAASPDFRYNPEVAFDSRKALYLEGSPIEILDLKPTGPPKVIIFDHDGTISTLRQGWEPIMKDVIVQSILGDSLDRVSREQMEKISVLADEMIDKTTGVQTIIQMYHLQELVKSSGYVSKEKILSPQEYKEIYNIKLLDMVSARVKLFKKNMLNLHDVTIKGAVPFLRALGQRDITLYLASGTDQSDVREEAATLGYADFFNGGIFGSVGDVDHDPKKMVIDKIRQNLPPGVKAEECYIFGDGPVEMREAAKMGFTRVGLMSDEKKRFGVNPEKRERLILGGAQALIPDFSWVNTLADHLEWNLDFQLNYDMDI